MLSSRASSRRGRQQSDLQRLIRAPSTSSPYEKYQDNLAGFFTEQLNVGLLTDPQKRVLHAVEKYRTVVVTSATGTGKTFLLAGLAIAHFVCWDRSGVYIAAASPESNLKTLAWGELTRFMARAPHLFKDTLSTDMTISKPERMPNGKMKPGRSRIQGLTIPSQGRDDKMETAFSGKHHEDNTAFFLDEADGIPDPCYRGINGCLSGSGHERSVLFYNPKARDGEPYDMLEQGRAHHVILSAFDHPNVQSGYDIIPGAVSRQVTVARLNEWSVPVTPEEAAAEPEYCFQTPDFLVGATAPDNKGGFYPPLPSGWRRGTDTQMFYKVLGIYPPLSAGYIVNPQKLADAVTRWHIYRQLNKNKPPDTAPRMGFDIADSPGGDSCDVVLKYGDYVDLPIRLTGIDAHDYALKGATIYKDKLVASCTVDIIGVGAGVPGAMREKGCDVVIGYKSNRKAPWSLEGKFDAVRDYCIYMLCRWINTSDTAMIPDDERLLKALKILKAATTDAVRVTDKREMRRVLGYSPGALDALAMLFAPATFFAGGI